MKHATHIARMIETRDKLKEDETKFILNRLRNQAWVVKRVIQKKYSTYRIPEADAIGNNEILWVLANGTWSIRTYDEHGVWITTNAKGAEHRYAKEGVRVPWQWLRVSEREIAKFTRELIYKSKANKREAAVLRAEYDLKEAQADLVKKQSEIERLEKLVAKKREETEAAKAKLQETKK